MAATRVFVSPGVYTSEKELSFVAQSVGVTTLGLVGETIKGPAFEPVFVTSYDDFTTYFGGTDPEKFINTQIPKYELAYIAKSYLQQSNQLFVTRILGLSGYDAGPSWSFKTIGQVDFDTVDFSSSPGNYNGNNVFQFFFTATTGSSYTTVNVNLNYNDYTFDAIPFRVDVPFSYNGSVTTILNELKKSIQNESDDFGGGNLSPNNYYVGGSIPDNGTTHDYGNISGNTLINFFDVDDLNGSTADLTSVSNRSWYQTIFEYQSTPPTSYVGYSFHWNIDDLDFGNLGSGVVSGACEFVFFAMTGTPYSAYDNLVVGTLRSRGVSDYTILNGGPVYEVTGTTDVLINCDTTSTTNPTGFTAYNELNYNPYATFTLSGVTKNGANFTYETSLSSSESNFISKVCGLTNFDKPKSSNPVFVEEIYSNLLNYGYNYGYIKGISCDLVSTDGARQYFLNNPNNTTGDTLGWYLDRYQTPSTPWVVSQLQGNKVTRLFRFISISDGKEANTEIKISILNVSFTNGTFDVAVRQYNDTDSNAVVIEKFTNCTMDPDTPGYVAKKIGTQNGEFGLNSKYIMVEVNPDADPNTLPCGFEGFINREYSTGTTTPFPIYKTKYYLPGELLYNSPVVGQVLSPGDKVRRVYLGMTNQSSAVIGVDSDLLQYKGRKYEGICNETNPEWNYQTKGFHLDSGATICVIGSEYTNSGETAFFVGDGSFSSEPTVQTNPYYYLYSRKFTLNFQGGFDGWNIYDERRTNSDDYQIGKARYLNAACISARFPTADGYLFKQITIDGNSVDWANTDYYAYLLGIQTFSNPAAVNINVFATPGIDYVNNEALVSNSIDMIENERADSIYVVTTPDWDMLTSNSTDYSTYFVQPQDAVDALETADIDSNYTATYYPWVLTRDSVTNTQIYLPPTAEVTRNLALTDNIAFPWFATAGYTRGIVNAVKARKKLTQEDRDTLYTGRINPIATFSDVGTVIWGNKTLQVSESALNRINVRRLLLQARKLISAVAIRLLFEQNDAKVRQDFLDAVNPILDSIRRDRGLYDFRVTVSSSVEDLDRNQLVGKIYIKPTKALEFIDIEFLITPTGASFENI